MRKKTLTFEFKDLELFDVEFFKFFGLQFPKKVDYTVARKMWGQYEKAILVILLHTQESLNKASREQLIENLMVSHRRMSNAIQENTDTAYVLDVEHVIKQLVFNHKK